MEQKYYEGKRKGTEVQRGLFQSSPTLTFVDEGVEIDGNVFETSDIDGLIRCLHDNASEKLLGAEMTGSVPFITRVPPTVKLDRVMPKPANSKVSPALTVTVETVMESVNV